MTNRLATLFVLISFALMPLTYGQIIDDLPDAVVCSVKDPTGFLPWEELVFYVSAHTRDGNTLYKTLTSDPVVLIVDKGGIIDASNLADCDGRHIDSLLEAGRAFHLTGPRNG